MTVVLDIINRLTAGRCSDGRCQHMQRILSARLGRRPAPRRALADSAPRIAIVMIDPEKVGMLIGPGGRVIRGIEADSGADEVSVSLPHLRAPLPGAPPPTSCCLENGSAGSGMQCGYAVT